MQPTISAAATWTPTGPTTPGKHTPLVLSGDDARDGASPGQIIVMFALFLVGMLAMLGLATDVGYVLAGRRATQGAADAGAIAGARMIARYTTAGPTSALPEVQGALADNGFGPADFDLHLCQYIGANWGVVGTCNQNVPGTAAGVRVQAETRVDTFFIQILPTVPDDIGILAYAKARVERAVVYPRNAPMMVCATGAWDVTGVESTTAPADGGYLTLFSGGQVSQAAIGKTVRVVDPQLGKHGDADCGSKDDTFTGMTDQGANGGKGVGSGYTYKLTGSPGPVDAELKGPDGCLAGASAPYDCVMVLPVVEKGESGSTKQLTAVGYAPFQVTAVDADHINATLLDDYIVSGDGTNTWCSACGGVVVVRLIW